MIRGRSVSRAHGARHPAALRLAALGLALAAGGCGTPQLPCPAAMVLNDASQVVKFAPGASDDPKNVRYVGEIADAKLNCSYDPKTYERMDVAMGVAFRATRPSASEAGTAELEYFVAIVNLEGELLARKEFPLQLRFPPGQAEASKVEEIRQIIPLKYPQNGGSLQIWVGFKLSDSELQYNRAHHGG